MSVRIRNFVAHRPLAAHMRLSLLAVIAVTLAAAIVPQAAVAAPARDDFEVLSATVHPDQAKVAVSVRCRARKARCAGILRLAMVDGLPLTAATRVHLVPGRTRRLSVRLRADGLRGVLDSGPEQVGTATLSAGGRRLAGEFTLDARPSCRSGVALAASADVRVFRLLGFGVYGCLLPAGEPVLVADEDRSSYFSTVLSVATAGRYVAAVVNFSEKCINSTVVLYDVSARHEVWQHPTSNAIDVDDGANGCISTTPAVSLLPRPSGATAWAEAAGDDGKVTIRAIDASGRDQTLDAAANIDAGSLRAVDATRIGWTRGGALQTATLQ